MTNTKNNVSMLLFITVFYLPGKINLIYLLLQLLFHIESIDMLKHGMAFIVKEPQDG